MSINVGTCLWPAQAELVPTAEPPRLHLRRPPQGQNRCPGPELRLTARNGPGHVCAPERRARWRSWPSVTARLGRLLAVDRAERRLFAALRAQALAPRQAQISRIWRVGACDHLCTATVVTLVFLTGIDGAGDRSRRPDHPRRLIAAVPVVLGSPPQVSDGVIPGGFSQLLGSGCPSGRSRGVRRRPWPAPTAGGA